MNGIDESVSLPGRIQSSGEELANSISHGIGLMVGVAAAPILLIAASEKGDSRFFIGAVIFTITMVAVYLGSTLYHAWPQSPRKSLLQLVDHSAIFLLIAGTYTPFALGPLGGAHGAAMLGLVWALAVLGIIVKVARGTMQHPRLALSLYLGMGWSGLLVIRPLSLAVPMPSLIWLIAGGVVYTAGVLFFLNERLRYGHFVWHLFVMAGTTCHFVALLACAA